MSEIELEYVTAIVGGQLFGLPIERVQDVFVPEQVTRVPLAGYEVAGVLNMRGRIVTVLDLRRLLGLMGDDDVRLAPMALGVEHRGESYGLLIDAIGEVIRLSQVSRQDNPVNLDAKLARVSAGVHRLDEQILIVLDVDRVLGQAALAA